MCIRDRDHPVHGRRQHHYRCTEGTLSYHHGPQKRRHLLCHENRQDAVKLMARQCDMVIVVGSSNSSNSNRLREVAHNMNVRAYLVDNASELQAEWLEGTQHVGLTAGASAPEVLVQEVITRLKQLGVASVHELHGISENVVFPLPKALNSDANTQ